MKALLLTAVFLEILSAATAYSEERNLALNRSYEMWPAPNYGDCADPEDNIQLTDGYTNYQAGRIWTEKPTVGWAMPLNEPAVIRFDLGAPATLSELKFYTAGGGGAGVVDVGLRVYVSLDDKSYIPAGERPAPGPGEIDKGTTRGIVMSVPLNGVKARYVAVAAMAPQPYYFVFVDEVEIIGAIPADPRSTLPVLPGMSVSGVRGLQEALTGGNRTAALIKSLLAPLERHLECWPADASRQQTKDIAEFIERGIKKFRDYDKLRVEVTERHRVLAAGVYKADTLVWEVIPDDAFGMLSLPDTLKHAGKASIDTVVNALEATALGAANLTEKSLPLTVSISGGGPGAPVVTPRIARFFATTNAKYVPDALLATDSPQAIPPGEARLIWLGATSENATPGLYRFSVTVNVGSQTHRVPLEVRVHNVILSKETPLSAGNWSDLSPDDGIFRKVRDDMLNHRMTVGDCTSGYFPSPKKDADGKVILPIQLDFAPLDAAIEFHKDFPQVSWFFPMHQSLKPPSYDLFGKAEWMSDEYKSMFKEWLSICVEHIKAKGRSYDGFYLQMFDETLDPKVAEICRLVKSVDPKVRMMITIPLAGSEAVRELVESGMNIFVYHAPRLGYDDAPDGFPLLRSGGRELWLYHAADSTKGDGKERDPLESYRLLHWVAFRHGATGVHFWNQVHNKTSGWIDETGREVYYPHVYVISEGFPPAPPDVKTAESVIPSRRWEYERMGIEDYMLLKMAQERIDKLGESGASYQKKLDVIVKTVLAAMGDRKLFRQKRLELIALVETLSGATDHE